MCEHCKEKNVAIETVLDELEQRDTKADISTMMISAERYALGRQTYIVQQTCEFIRNNKNLLLEKDRQIIIKDIKNCSNYGAACDKEEWIKLLNELEKEK